VLDYGCGDALHADLPAEIAKRIILCEAAPKLRETLTQRFAANPKIVVASPDEVAAFELHSLDLIVIHSVAQYHTEDEFSDRLMLFHNLLKAEGMLLVGDIIPRRVSAFTDAMALLRFARAEGFFFAALFGLVRTVFSNYWELRSTIGLTRYDKEEILIKLTRAGFWATQAPKNIGHNPARMTFIARMALTHVNT